MASLRKNVASQNITFQLNAKADGTPVTAGGAGNVVIDGGSQAACAGTFTHKGTGQWNYAPTQSETNGTNIGFQFTGTGAININFNFYTDNWDTTQPVLTSGSASNQLTVSSGVASANATQLAGQTVTAGAGVTFPGSIASPTNITAGTITTVTNLTNAPTAGDFTAAMKTSLNAATPTVTAGTVTDKTGYSLSQSFPSNFSAMAITAGGAVKVDGTSALTESYAAQGAAFTLAQGMYQMNQLLGQQSISGTTLTTKKRDGSTTAKTYTLDSSTAPTSISETT